MKKGFNRVLMITGMLAMTMPMAVQAESVNNVWIDGADIEYNEAEWKVEVMTDGKSSDGLLEVAYNTALLSVEEADVQISENVEMYSVNVTDDGKLKIAYLSEKTVEKGVLAEIVFTAKSENVTIDALELTGEVHTPDGKELDVGIMLEEELQDPTEENPTEQKPADSESGEKETKEPVEGVDTGDMNKVGVLAAALVASLGTMIGMIIKKRGI